MLPAKKLENNVHLFSLKFKKNHKNQQAIWIFILISTGVIASSFSSSALAEKLSTSGSITITNLDSVSSPTYKGLHLSELLVKESVPSKDESKATLKNLTNADVKAVEVDGLPRTKIVPPMGTRRAAFYNKSGKLQVKAYAKHGASQGGKKHQLSPSSPVVSPIYSVVRKVPSENSHHYLVDSSGQRYWLNSSTEGVSPFAFLLNRDVREMEVWLMSTENFAKEYPEKMEAYTINNSPILAQLGVAVPQKGSAFIGPMVEQEKPSGTTGHKPALKEKRVVDTAGAMVWAQAYGPGTVPVPPQGLPKVGGANSAASATASATTSTNALGISVDRAALWTSDPAQLEQFLKTVPRSVVSQFKNENDLGLNTSLMALQSSAQATVWSSPGVGSRQWVLMNLNPAISRVYLLGTKAGGASEKWKFITLENPFWTQTKDSALTTGGYWALLQHSGKMHVANCNVYDEALKDNWFESTSSAYRPVCGGKLWIKSNSRGYKTTVESATDILRQTGSTGESVITLYKELFPPKGDGVKVVSGSEGADNRALTQEPFKIQITHEERVAANNLGIELSTGSKSMQAGRWYVPKSHMGPSPKVFVSALAPEHVGVQASEAQSLAYFIAFELNAKTPHMGYVPGVEHPSLGWSSRVKVPTNSSPGPDGFNNDAPIARGGLIGPWDQERVQLVFAGGFKRDHSGFRVGTMASTNNGHHYGFSDFGVQRSSIMPGLATLWWDKYSGPSLQKWSADMASKIPSAVFMRQNGLLLVENGKPSNNVQNMLSGNWSGNAQGEVLTMRSGFCLRTEGTKVYGVYGVFTMAAPPHMAQVFSAMGCQSAMQLDMNAPALTYAALIHPKTQTYEPLLTSMKEGKDNKMGRFISNPDSRDFFYVLAP